jgi:hypothetical protein
MWYSATVLELADETSGVDIKEDMKSLESEEAKRALDRMLAEASQTVVTDAAEVFAALPPVIAQAMTMMEQFAPQVPPDPRVALEGQKMQAQQQRDQAQMQMDAQKMQMQVQKDQTAVQIEGQKMQAEAMQTQAEMQLQAQKLQIEQQLEQMKQDREDARKSAELNARMTMNQQDNQTAMQLAQAEIMSGERIAVSTGTGINPQP